MKALRVHKDGDGYQLSVDDIPKPVPKEGELLVRIKASYVQPADILNSKGSFGGHFPRVIGKDFSGIVVEGPPEWKGKEVFGTSGDTFSFTSDGAQAEYTILQPYGVAEKPKTISFAQAAAVGTVWSAALTELFRARTKPTDTVMVLGATGNVGSAVTQIAKKMGCKTIGVGRHNTDVNSQTDPTLSKARELTNGKGPEVVCDTVGDLDLIHAALVVMADRGRMSLLAAPRKGTTVMPLDIFAFYRSQKELIGCNTAGSSQTEMVNLLRDLVPNFESGALVPIQDKDMNFLTIDQAKDAYDGKVKRAVITFD